MSITKWLEGIVGKMKWYDISLVKLTVFFATLTLLTAWAGFREFLLRFEWYWYLAITFVLTLPMLKKIFGK